MRHEYARFAVTMDNGELRFLSFVTLGRGSILPSGAARVDNIPDGWWRREPTDARMLEEILRAYPIGKDARGEPWPRPARTRRISEEEFQAIQADRTYRDACSDDGTRIGHDMAKARQLQLSRVRRARAGKLDALDRDYMRATGQGKKREAEGIEATRQKLRDLPVTLNVDAATTIEELKTKWSPELD